MLFPNCHELGRSVNIVRVTAFCLSVALVAAGGVARSAEDFPITGTFTQNIPCKGDGSDPIERQVKLLSNKIISQAGICKFLKVTSKGSVIEAELQCELSGGAIVGDVTFTSQTDNTIKFTDYNQNYRSLLYRCPD